MNPKRASPLCSSSSSPLVSGRPAGEGTQPSQPRAYGPVTRSMDGTDLCGAMLRAARPLTLRPRGVPAKRGWSSDCRGRPAALPRPSPPPPLAAGGGDNRGSVMRLRGEAEMARGRRRGGGDGAQREEAAAGNAVVVSGGSVGDGAEGVAGLVVGMVVLEERESGGGELGRKRGLALAAHPPPKRRAVSAKRQFPPGCGRGAAPLTVGGGGGEEGLRVAAAPSHGGFSVLELAVTAPPAGSGGSEEGGLLLEAAPANAGFGELEKVAAADGGAPVADGYHHGPEAAVVKFSDGAENVAGLVVKDRGRAAGSGELGMNTALVLIARLPPKRRMISAKRRFPPGCGRGVVAPLASRRGGGVCLQLKAQPTDGGLGSVEEMVTTEGGGSASDLCTMDIVESASKNALDGIVEVHELEEGEIPSDSDHVLQESEVTLNIISHESTAGRHECAVPAVLAAEPSVGHLSNEKISGNILQPKGKSAAWAVVEDVKVMNKCEGSSHKVAAEPSTESPPIEHIRDKGVSKSYSVKIVSLDVAAGVFGKGMTRSKATYTARKAVWSHVEANNKLALVTPDRSYSMGKVKESVGTIRESLAPKKKLDVKAPAQGKRLPMNVTSTSTLLSKEKLKEKDASHLEDDEISKVLDVIEGKLELYLNVPSCIPSVWRHMQHGGQNADARTNVRMICGRFQFICRTLVQAVEQRSLKVRRVDLAADKVIRKLPGFTKYGPIVGKVPGVEIGDEFLYRVELAIVGLHRPYQGGIDTTKDINDTLIAISIVASGGYPDELSSSGEVIYTGSGGKPAGKENEDQKLERGNLALKNCINTKTPVRVIHGFKGQNREEGSHSRAKEISTFTYDGLYLVVDCWQEGLPGSRVFKYKLERIPGQPELPLHVAKGLRKSIVRPGLCIADISQGMEKTPICVINDIDNARPASFIYSTRIKYSSLPAKGSPQGCHCTDGCSDSASCACAVKNGGEIPFNFNRAVVHAKPLIFECGPFCRCPPSCHNRVSQLGMKIPLEVFRTTKTGWGVRSLRSIPSGSFICEYVGELLHGKEANQRRNDEYLFGIGHNYEPSVLPGLNSSGPRSLTIEDIGFTIDAARYGNIGRFINHSCSPNLYAQSVLWDHYDQRMPRIMFFAAENISPLQELTYDYNYKIDHVHDVNGRVKTKSCHCGSPQCSGRLC